MRRAVNVKPRLWRSIIVAMTVIAGLRALIPLGFMPAIESGRLTLIECTGHMAPHSVDFVNSHAHNAHHENERTEPSGTGSSHWEASGACPFSLGSISIAANPQLFAGSAAGWLSVIARPVFALHARNLPGSLSARGPPISF